MLRGEVAVLEVEAHPPAPRRPCSFSPAGQTRGDAAGSSWHSSEGPCGAPPAEGLLRKGHAPVADTLWGGAPWLRFRKQRLQGRGLFTVLPPGGPPSLSDSGRCPRNERVTLRLDF